MKKVLEILKDVETVVSKINVLRYMYPEECYIQPKVEEETTESAETPSKEEIKTEIPNNEVPDVHKLVSNTLVVQSTMLLRVVKI